MSPNAKPNDHSSYPSNPCDLKRSYRGSPGSIPCTLAVFTTQGSQLTPPSKIPEPPPTIDSVAATTSTSTNPEGKVTQVMDISPSELIAIRGKPILSPKDRDALRVRLIKSEEDMDVESCFRNTSKQEKPHTTRLLCLIYPKSPSPPHPGTPPPPWKTQVTILLMPLPLTQLPLLLLPQAPLSSPPDTRMPPPTHLPKL